HCTNEDCDSNSCKCIANVDRSSQMAIPIRPLWELTNQTVTAAACASNQTVLVGLAKPVRLRAVRWATGQQLWQIAPPGFDHISDIIVNGNIVIVVSFTTRNSRKITHIAIVELSSSKIRWTTTTLDWIYYYSVKLDNLMHVHSKQGKINIFYLD